MLGGVGAGGGEEGAEGKKKQIDEEGAEEKKKIDEEGGRLQWRKWSIMIPASNLRRCAPPSCRISPPVSDIDFLPSISSSRFVRLFVSSSFFLRFGMFNAPRFLVFLLVQDVDRTGEKRRNETRTNDGKTSTEHGTGAHERTTR